MNHRFLLNVELPDGVLLSSTNRLLTREIIEAGAQHALRAEILAITRRDSLSHHALSIVTEPAPARAERSPL